MMTDDEYIIQTKYCESFDFVFMKKDELSYENYVFQGKTDSTIYLALLIVD